LSIDIFAEIFWCLKIPNDPSLFLLCNVYFRWLPSEGVAGESEGKGERGSSLTVGCSHLNHIVK